MVLGAGEDEELYYMRLVDDYIDRQEESMSDKMQIDGHDSR